MSGPSIVSGLTLCQSLMSGSARRRSPLSATTSHLKVSAWSTVRYRSHSGSPDKKVLSEDEKKTQEYDQLAFRLVSYAAIPMLLAYSVYSRQSFLSSIIGH